MRVTNSTSRPRIYPDQLRDDIDRGRTGDKVANPDPSAAPLGTDEEAAGTPVSAHAAAVAHGAETGRRGSSTPPNTRGRGWIVSAALLVLALAAVGGLLLL
jgi:hypothetical protein